jgi:hypothetical protein
MRRMRRLLGCVLGLLLLALPALAQGPLDTDLAVLGGLPAELAGFQRGGITDYATMSGDPGLGASVEYRAPEGAIATVYLYDRGRRDLTGAARTAAIEDEIQVARREVQAVSAARRYRVQADRPAADVADGPGRTRFRCRVLDLAFADGRRLDSFICATVRRGRFLKLRLSALAAAPGATAAQVQAFGQAVLAQLR